jgi:hypothetical protein
MGRWPNNRKKFILQPSSISVWISTFTTKLSIRDPPTYQTGHLTLSADSWAVLWRFFLMCH